MKPKVFITGADGFIGSHLVERLVRDGYPGRALCLYNSFNDIGWLKDVDPSVLCQVEIILGDIRDSQYILKALKDCNIVFHLAWMMYWILT